ncbi:MAG TPA: tol-pal system protein YbgF [Gammaproteobacteria bacterium]|nr:tol-pal system protein YbgF [Gammaproteobacteria bacterium]
MRRYRLWLVPVLVVALGGCAGFQSQGGGQGGQPTTAQRVDQLQQKVHELSRQVNAQGQVNLTAQVQQLQQDVRKLRGQVEENQHNLDELRQRQRDLYVDVDKRLRALETGQAGSKGQSGGAAASGQSGQQSGQASGGGGNDEKDYEAAFTLLKNGRYAKAVSAFQQFLKAHPNSTYAPNAQYWIGEAKYVSEDMGAAMQAFQTVVGNYPSSDKVPDALLKIGYIHYQNKDWKKARSALQKVVNKYPNSGAAQLAKQRLARMDREGH